MTPASWSCAGRSRLPEASACGGRTPPDVTPRQRRSELERAHPGWLVFHDGGIGVWSAFRRSFPDGREVRAGIRALVKAACPECLDEKLTRQAEILDSLPPCHPLPNSARSSGSLSNPARPSGQS
ncbi:hypothetical protein [Streptosporangium carneum]|uniref:Uncharacterized protein n=1 Tax=Streptosporangium carneum TaxID=47481 RepID=A0A9W6IBY7_9ACTN|nr:hypothetical protein [Streptosporangium carneum]GLK15246.1 hypothetical protein GCM10017600_86590 [Streptosporangium carneum]